MAKFFYTYVLESLKDKEFYIGWTNDLVSRVNKHNKRLVFATKSKSPFKLIYYEACLSRKLAIKREKSLKTGFGRRYLKRRVGKV
jgi:putative endonuclease